MKIKVNRHQLDLLLQNMHWLNGVSLEMSEKTFKKIFAQELVNESKLYKVGIKFGSYSTATMVVADSGELARITAGKMFPNATIHTATEINCKLK